MGGVRPAAPRAAAPKKRPKERKNKHKPTKFGSSTALGNIFLWCFFFLFFSLPLSSPSFPLSSVSCLFAFDFSFFLVPKTGPGVPGTGPGVHIYVYIYIRAGNLFFWGPALRTELLH